MSAETNSGTIDLLPRHRTADEIVDAIASLRGIDTNPQGEIIFALSRDEMMLLPDGHELTDPAEIAILLNHAISTRFTGRATLEVAPHKVHGFRNISECCVLEDGFTIRTDKLVQVQSPGEHIRPVVREYTITAGYNLAEAEA